MQLLALLHYIELQLKNSRPIHVTVVNPCLCIASAYVMCPQICPQISENFCPQIFFPLCSGLSPFSIVLPTMTVVLIPTRL